MTVNPNPENGTEDKELDLDKKPAEEDEKPSPESKAEPDKKPDEGEEVDYKKKFAESTTENQIAQARIKELEDEKARRESTKEPTDSDLRAAFPDWDEMTPTEQRATRIAFEAKQRTDALSAEREAEKAEREWNERLEDTILAHPELEGKETAFKDFARKPSHRGAPLDVLADAFLHKAGSPSPAPTPKQGLESGNGGLRVEEKPKTLSGEDLKRLRETDYPKYLEYIKAHDIAEGI